MTNIPLVEYEKVIAGLKAHMDVLNFEYQHQLKELCSELNRILDLVAPAPDERRTGPGCAYTCVAALKAERDDCVMQLKEDREAMDLEIDRLERRERRLARSKLRKNSNRNKTSKKKKANKNYAKTRTARNPRH